jgi:uncharacterized protein YdaU (DUF1376 family)
MAGDKKADTWMPLWIGAYLADTMKLTTLQHGAYLLLLIAYWRERKALADDDEELRAITKLDRAEWKKVRPVLAKFFRVGDGVWWHKRVEAEIAQADERAKKAAEKAGRAAQARWKKPQEQSTSNAPSMPQALPEDMHEECPPPSPIPLTTFADSVPGGTEQAAKDWLKVRKSHRAPLTESAWEGIVSEASKAGITPSEAVQVCARKDWRGFNHTWDWQSAGVVSGAVSTAKTRNRQEERRNTMAALGGEFVTGASHATGDYIDV